MEKWTYEEAVEALFAAPRFKEVPSVVNIRRYLDFLGHPERAFRVVHVAGTNGKGSTCAFLEGILRGMGARTGLFTSPHLISPRERVQIDRQPVGREEFARAFGRIKEAERESGFSPLTFFESILVMALLIFREEKVQWAVAEAGMGGRSDATSALEPELCILTAVGMDHMEYLGRTLGEIAREKAGIMKKGIPCVAVDHDSEITGIFREEAAKIGCPLRLICPGSFKILKNSGKAIDFLVENRYYMNSVFSVCSSGRYQAENACVAAVAAKILFPGISDSLVGDSLRGVSWPGRMEQVGNGVIVDGAHNEPSIRAFMDTVRRDGQRAGNRVLVFCVARDKDYISMARELLRDDSFGAVVLAGLPCGRMEDPEKLKPLFQSYARVPVYTKKSMEEAYRLALSLRGEGGLVYVTGSLYFVGSFRKYLMGDGPAS